ncbi:MAG TPA: GDSL-type esterase/lipase family protein [Prolixibacteraceae bacterium]|nr:GDSL-type esterase/lipase family protein [Prolixibacteraceae bacterium]
MRLSVLFLFLFVSLCSLGQNSKFGTYYDQRKSLFEILPDTKNEIIFLGNSITDGSEWSELIQNAKAKNRGISGDTSEGVLFRLYQVTRVQPAKVFLLIGVNDLAKNISPDTVYVNICKIVSVISTKSPKTKVYVQSILPVNNTFKSFASHTSRTPQVKDLNERLKNICPKLGATYVDLFSELKNPNDDLLNPMYTNDGLHLTGEGYKAWARVIQQYL